jgi:alkylation response protein AidB-like acyl-CoA dehydrogenase
MIVMEALGRGLVVEPYLGAIVVAGTILRAAASPAQLESIVPGIIEGKSIVVLAASEKQARYQLEDVATTAVREGNEYRITGSKILVVHGDRADSYIVSARSGGARIDRNGVSLFLVDANALGLRRRCYHTQDGLRASDLLFDQVRVPASALLGTEGAGLAALERAEDFAIAALAAESTGIMQALLDLTVDYLKQRKQFGGPIGRFQALQHKAADMLVELEQMRSMAIYAALMVEEPNPAERRRALAMVKAQIGQSGRAVGQAAVQLHGGIGVTEEYAVGHYFKRLTMIDCLFGDREFQLSRLAAGEAEISTDLSSPV